jgi:hypothetical protein
VFRMRLVLEVHRSGCDVCDGVAGGGKATTGLKPKRRRAAPSMGHRPLKRLSACSFSLATFWLVGGDR